MRFRRLHQQPVSRRDLTDIIDYPARLCVAEQRPERINIAVPRLCFVPRDSDARAITQARYRFGNRFWNAGWRNAAVVINNEWLFGTIVDCRKLGQSWCVPDDVKP